MTRETKIGLLVGLTVIVLIGVLMSDYLNKSPVEPQEARLSQTMGADYRQAQLEPGQLPNASLALAPAPGRALPSLADSAQALPLAAGVDGPRMEAPAVPQPLGPATPSAAAVTTMTSGSVASAAPATIYVPGLPPTVTPRVVAAQDSMPSAPASAAPAGQAYTVVHGDTLTRIARKFYGSASRANMARIVAANSRLKDMRTPLLAGEKLAIPGTAGQADAAIAPPQVTARGRTALSLPGRTRVEQTNAPAPEAQRASAASRQKTYTVKKGDTLASIAKRLLGSSSRAAVEKLAAANGIKDVNTVRVGQVIRVP